MCGPLCSGGKAAGRKGREACRTVADDLWQAVPRNVTPMRELSQDSDVGRVIVEGRVFAVNHKELKKRKRGS